MSAISATGVVRSKKFAYSKPMNIKTFVAFVVVALMIVIAMPLLRGKYKEPVPSSNNSTGLIVGTNAIYVEDQAPSKTILVATVRLEKPGFVIVFDDANGVPGKILGRSDFLPAGEMENLLPIQLSRKTQDGEILYIALHFDDGDGMFDVTKDQPALDSTSALPVMTIITVSTEAAESPDAVSL
ncbi:MAG: hypothetical protein Greene07144_920 [Parcubacteria group bacterium Greene0714_4]|nr:MAG: hypothetical protein Greene07144_920 [Parcubacteria group bacterium Greene0714_4]